MKQQKIVPALWYAKGVEEAAKFYASVFPESKIERVASLPADSPSGPAGSVIVVELTLFGQRFQMMEAGPLDTFNHAISFAVRCEDQAEIDRYWGALLEGGKPEQCGWLKDRYGVSWQIVPRVLDDMMVDPDRDKARRAAEAMLKMVKLDLGKLRAAFNGER
jgi:predicted 3-demethylubiquinone-9 3-methyltransferase (glyoxalase superfamily)